MDEPADRKPGGELPNCNECAHFFITHDPGFRYGCRAMDFKSQRLPMLDVLEASGQPCQLFRQKAPRP